MIYSLFSPSCFNHLRIILPLLLAFQLISGSISAQDHAAVNGIFDARAINLDQQRIPLNGNWSFYENQLVPPTDFTARATFVYFPRTWNEIKISGSGIGYASYHLIVLLPHHSPSLALEFPQIYSSYQVWVNGKPLATNGKVAKTKEESIPQWNPQTVSFENPGDTLEIHIQISNFRHNKGGSKDPIYLGGSDLMQQHRSLSVWSNLAEAAILGLMGLSLLILYMGTDKKKITVYFALLCLSWGLRSLFSNQYIFISFYPDFNWTAMLKIEYITMFLSLIWAMLFTHRLFPAEGTNVIKYLLVGINLALIAFVLIAEPLQFSRFITFYVYLCGIVLLFCVTIVLRAWINERVGVVFLVISLLLGMLIFGYDLLSYGGVFTYTAALISLGYAAVFLIMAPALLLHLNILKTKAKPSNFLSYKDLYGDGTDAMK